MSAAASNPGAGRRWFAVGRITAVALGLFLVFRWLPTGTNLSHLDFRPGGNSVEMCDPSNPQFIPVVSVRSPVTMTLPPTGATAGVPYKATLTLVSASGKPIGPNDLLVVHTRKLHLLIVDPSLTDYQHVHPEPGAREGEWTFSFTPRRSGLYRIFGDFTPLATGRGLYGHADLPVEGDGDGATASGLSGYTVELRSADPVLKARRMLDLTLRLKSDAGGAVPLEPVMGAYAHLVAFDEGRSGYAHLHPKEADLLKKPEALRPEMLFNVTIPRAGRYVVWAQLNLGGREAFFPFTVDVVE